MKRKDVSQKEFINMATKEESKKKQVIEELYRHYTRTGNPVFHNNLVKEISAKLSFGNPFDATKIDNKTKLPKILLDNDYTIIHLGNGNHRFMKGISKVYHDFEPIQETYDWAYKKSILNQYNTSESNILSVANNQRLLHYFLFGEDKEFENVDIAERPKTYFPHRTKTSLDYFFGRNTPVSLKNIQIEIDLTIEFQGIIGVFEGKNGKPDSFNVYQIYHPFLYYYNANKDIRIKGKIEQIYCIYVVRESNKNGDVIKLWQYTFEDPLDITTIKFIKSTAYNLINKV
jgi:hypothetical protein